MLLQSLYFSPTPAHSVDLKIKIAVTVRRGISKRSHEKIGDCEQSMKDIIRRPVEHSSRSAPQRTAEGTISSSNNMIELFSDLLFNRCRNSSIGRTLDCRAGGRGFDSRDRTNTLGLKVTEK